MSDHTIGRLYKKKKHYEIFFMTSLYLYYTINILVWICFYGLWLDNTKWQIITRSTGCYDHRPIGVYRIVFTDNEMLFDSRVWRYLTDTQKQNLSEIIRTIIAANGLRRRCNMSRRRIVFNLYSYLCILL